MSRPCYYCGGSHGSNGCPENQPDDCECQVCREYGSGACYALGADANHECGNNPTFAEIEEWKQQCRIDAETDWTQYDLDNP